MVQQKQIKLGLIGAGRQGTRIANTVAALETATITKISSKSNGVDWKDVLHSGIDGLIVAADPKLNDNIVQCANIINMPVFLEKPASLYVHEARKLAKHRIPILVDYTQLFSDKYQNFKSLIPKPLQIVIYNYNVGPVRYFSPLYDYAPHALALALDICGIGDFVIKKQTATKGKEGGILFSLHLTLNGVDLHILTGNGGTERKNKIGVLCKDDTNMILNFNDVSEEDYKQPLRSALEHFIDVIQGKKTIRIPIDFTVKIHELLHKLGKNAG
jgi:hypothetical protein